MQPLLRHNTNDCTHSRSRAIPDTTVSAESVALDENQIRVTSIDDDNHDDDHNASGGCDDKDVQNKFS